MQYFRPEVEKNRKIKYKQQQQKHSPSQKKKKKKKPKCQIQILRYETNWNGKKILIAIFINYEIWEITDSEK